MKKKKAKPKEKVLTLLRDEIIEKIIEDKKSYRSVKKTLQKDVENNDFMSLHHDSLAAVRLLNSVAVYAEVLELINEVTLRVVQEEEDDASDQGP